MDPVLIAIAFILGFAVRLLGLPPLVGYLAAGFALNYFGIDGGEWIEVISDLGVLLLLFSIGLKLKIKDLLKPEIWGGAGLQMILTVVLLGSLIYFIGFFGISEFTNLSLQQALIVAFALSFSSTVFVVKILEQNGTVSSIHGKISIGILIIQDLLAVLYLSASGSKTPTLWALLLLPLLLLPLVINRRPLSVIFDKAGHGELLILLGILIPISAAGLFTSVGLKADLGALVFGFLLANHPKAKEISDSLLGFKDVFLVGFFLSIGLAGFPTLEAVGVATIFTLLLPLKIVLFFIILTRFNLRSRTALLASFNLANYSEFGLIVGAASVAAGWLPSSWLTILALSLAFSYVLASGLDLVANNLLIRWHDLIHKYEHPRRLPEEDFINLQNIEIIVLGMGRVGTAVYEVIEKANPEKVLGIDFNYETVRQRLAQEQRIILGSATDYEFWQRVQDPCDLKLAILAMESHTTHLRVIKLLKQHYPEIRVAGVCRYEDEITDLEKLGVDIVFNLYSEAGRGYGNHILTEIGRVS